MRCEVFESASDWRQALLAFELGRVGDRNGLVRWFGGLVWLFGYPQSVLSLVAAFNSTDVQQAAAVCTPIPSFDHSTAAS